MKTKRRRTLPLTSITILAVIGIALCIGFIGMNQIVKQEIELNNFNSDQHSDTPTRREGPFSMPLHGKKYEIFQPLYDMDEKKKDIPLLASPQDFIETFKARISWADTMVTKREEFEKMSTKDHATFMYLEMMKSYLTASVFMGAEISVIPRLGQESLETNSFNLTTRNSGNDWTYSGDTMTGFKRIDNVKQLLTDVIKNKIKGDYMETGVWRGGMSVFAKAVLSVLEPKSTRMLYVCDSFMGLPPGDKNLAEADKNWDQTPFLEVSTDIVANNFIKYNLLDSNVVFAKGFFNETMPPLSKYVKKMSLLRLDGDMYESTVDVLYHFYDKLSIGGYLIMDDWNGFPSKDACEDFFEVHGISPEIIPIDDLSAYWKKTEEVNIQYWRYEQSKFKKTKA